MVLAHEIQEGTRTKDIKTSLGVTFSSMLLAPKTIRGLQNSGFFKPSPIQLHAIPLGKCGFDLILEAKSGTGKTAVFSIIALEKLDLKKGLQTIILAPTREIAAQVCDVIKQIGCCYEGLQVEVVMGGLPVQDDITKFKKKVHILVGSPGRLRQLIQEKHVNVASVRLIVLDEADRLVAKSFLADINYIFSSLPQQKQVIMSSATYPKKTKEDLSNYLQGAQHICPDTDNILLGIEQRVILVKHNTNIVKQTKFRFEELLKILSTKPFKQCLIFCNYQARVAEVGKMLRKEKWPAEQLYGQQDQTDRLEALKTLQEYGCRILVSTDLASRGIDASNVNLIINFEPPFEWQTYLHRIGRAGRFGSYGTAVTILSEGQEENKFKTMIGEIRGTINLKKFWDDEMFVAEVNSNISNTTESDSEPLEVTDLKEEPAFQKLWDTFTSPIQKDTKEIESFETLCKSFQETKESEVESFSDLVNSFNMHEHNNNDTSKDSPYQCLSQPDIPAAKYCAIIKNMHSETHNKLEIDNQSQRNANNTEDMDNQNFNVEFKKLNINSKFAATTTERYIERPYHLQNGNSDCEIEEAELTYALRKAGLPTAFGSSKDRKSNKKRNFIKNNKQSMQNSTVPSETFNHNNMIYNNVHNNNTAELEACNGINTVSHQHTFRNGSVHEYSRALECNKSGISNDSRSNNVSNCEFNYIQSLTKQHEGSNNIAEDIVCDNASPYKITKMSPVYHLHRNKTEACGTFYDDQDNTHKPNCTSNTKCSKVTSNDDSESDSSEELTLSEEYINWYKTLKYRTLQVQLAVYVDELSKL